MNWTTAIQFLNGLGLPLLTVAIWVIYKALVHRTELLQGTVEDVKRAYEAILEATQRRADEFDRLLDGQRKFNELYIKIVADTEAHKEKIKEWLSSDITILEKKIERLTDNLAANQRQYEELAAENKALRGKLEDLEDQYRVLEIRLKNTSGNFVLSK